MYEFSLFSATQIGSFRISERPHVSSSSVNLPQRRTSVRPLNAEPKRNDFVVPLAATIVAPGAFPLFCFVINTLPLFWGKFFWFPKMESIDVMVCDTAGFAEVTEKEEEDFEQLSKDLGNASPLEIMDKALEKFGNDIAIAFR